MARPRHDPNAVDTKVRVLRAAEKAFADKGFAGATLAEIARGAGIRRPSLLYHFGSKDQLYAAVVEGAFGAMGAVLLESMAAPGTFEQRLRAVSSSYTGHLEAHPWLARLILREMLDDRGPGHELLLGGLAPLLEQVVAFIEQQGAGQLRQDIHVRAVLMDVASAELVRIASGGLGQRLWPADIDMTEQSALLFLHEATDA